MSSQDLLNSQEPTAREFRSFATIVLDQHAQVDVSHREGFVPEGVISRREFLRCVERLGVGFLAAGFVSGGLSSVGCVSSTRNGSDARTASRTDLVFGQRGLSDGRFQKPRAMAISPKDEIYVIDKTARVQVFDANGVFLRGWKTPEAAHGKPTGATFDSSTGNLLVADTHYFRYLAYSPQGELLEPLTIGGENGPDPGQFGWVTDITRSRDGGFYLSEYGEYDRIYKYTADRQYIDRFGEHGDGPLQFSRPQTLDVDAQGFLWVADACNHRIQVIDWREEKPRLVNILGGQGSEVGRLQFPYGLTLISEDRLLVSEFGNHRVQCWTREGKPISAWGSAGKEPGQLNQPWAVAIDSRERVYVVDSGNNRVQRFKL